MAEHAALQATAPGAADGAPVLAPAPERGEPRRPARALCPGGPDGAQADAKSAATAAPNRPEGEPSEESTDEGSDSSDAETVASTAAASDAGAGREAGGDRGPAGILRLPVPRGHGAKKQVRFLGTPLSPIPGTPVAVDVGARASPEARHAWPPAPGALRSSHAAMATKVRESSLVARAREEMLPLRVQIPQAATAPLRPLQRGLPAKKRPPFPDVAGSAAAMILSMDRAVPVKKSVPKFLLTMPHKVHRTRAPAIQGGRGGEAP